jgi:arabinogalactan endo-1,4-beta-galactosidase
LGKSLFSELLEDVYAHTYDVIDALSGWSNSRMGSSRERNSRRNDVAGRQYKLAGKTQLLNKGYEATKAIDPKIKVINSLDEGNNLSSDGSLIVLKQNKVKYDVIGLSYYPFGLKKIIQRR